MIRRPPRSTPLYSSAASDVYKRQIVNMRYKMNRKHFYIFFMVIGLIITNGFGTALGSQFNYSMKNQSLDDPSSFLVDSNLIFGTATWSDGGYAYGASVT